MKDEVDGTSTVPIPKPIPTFPISILSFSFLIIFVDEGHRLQ